MVGDGGIVEVSEGMIMASMLWARECQGRTCLATIYSTAIFHIERNLVCWHVQPIRRGLSILM
jgi:hypothetical protein